MAWKTQFADLCKKTHSAQAIWWLNGYWDEGAKEEVETIYKFAQQFKELEYGGKIIEVKGKAKEKIAEYKEGSDLEEFKAHRFLETVGETHTVVELRKKLETIDLDKNKRMALSEYLLFRYKKKPDELVNKSQGDNQKEIEAAQKQLAELSSSLAELQQKLEEQKSLLAQQQVEEEASRKAAEEAKVAEAAANSALEAQKAAEALVKKAEDELRAAVDDLARQEKEHKDKIAALEAKASDASLSTVAKSKAANELAQLKGEDPMPLRKAKITQEAALRKVEKERKAAEAATKAATDKATAAEEARKGAEEAAKKAEEARLATEALTVQVEAAQKETQEKFEAAQKTLDDLKAKSGSANGAIWWMNKELQEASKFLVPKKK